MKLNKIMSGVLSLSMISGAAVPVLANDTVYTQDVSGEIVLADTSGAASIYIDPNSSEYDGISLAADAVAGDIESITGQRPDVVYHPAVATATVNKMLIYKGFNDLYASQGSMLANTYAALTMKRLRKRQSCLIQKRFHHSALTGFQSLFLERRLLRSMTEIMCICA